MPPREPSARVRRRIAEAADDGRLVRVTRRQGWDRLDGSIVARSPKWLLLAIEVEAGWNGHVLVRVAHVRGLQRLPNAGFVENALAAEGRWPLPRLEGLDLASTRGRLRTLAQTGAMVSFHYERDHADECVIGAPRSFGKRRFRVQTVDPDAAWEPEDTVFPYRSITRLDVGGEYERRLAVVAGAAPPWLSPEERRRSGSRGAPYRPVPDVGRRRGR